MVLKISISGVRGLIDNGLDDQVAYDLGASFGTYLRRRKESAAPRIGLARDTRPSGPRLEAAFLKGLALTGSDVLKFGVVPTPTAQINVTLLGLDGAVVVSASHNPVEWNGFKFIGERGIFLTEAEAQQFIRIFHSKRWAEHPNGVIQEDANVLTRHIDKILTQLKITDPLPKLRVAVDAVNGAGSLTSPQLLKQLGMEVVPLHCENNGKFLRGAEPLPENLAELGRIVTEKKCDVGFAQDPDADRLAMVDEKGVPLGEDLTVALGVDALLQSAPPSPKKIVVNLSTSMAIDEVARRYNAKVIRTSIGEVYVSEGIVQHKAFAGGEGNGGLINPAIGFGRDSLGAMATILRHLTKKKIRISDWARPYRGYTIIKDKIAFTDAKELKALLARVKAVGAGAQIDERDGVKLTWSDRWLHVRASNTEPIVRIMAEGKSAEIARGLVEKIVSRKANVLSRKSKTESKITFDS